MYQKNQHSNLDSFIYFIKNYGLVFLLIFLLRFCRLFILKFLGFKFIKKNIFNFSMFLDVNDIGISKALFLYEKRELELKYILDKYLKPGMNVFDIGSNIGYYALIINNLIKDKGFIVSIEPSETNFNLLKKNLKLNNCKRIITINGAVSDSNSKKKFYLSNMSNLNSFHNQGSVSKHLSGKEVIVDTYTIPEIINKTKIVPDLIRMDVEGHEVEILKGMINLLKTNEISPIIVFETHITTYNINHSINGILLELFKIGYQAKIVGSSREHGSKLLESLGYKSDKTFLTDKVKRKIFYDINQNDLFELLENKGGIRSILLSK